MNRRDFLRLRVRGAERVLELSCERLYVRYVNARAGERLRSGGPSGGAFTVGGGATVGAPGGSATGERAPGMWEGAGEPPLEIAAPSAADLFAELERRLASANVLRVLDPEWLAEPELRREVEARLEAFRARGGRVA